MLVVGALEVVTGTVDEGVGALDVVRGTVDEGVGAFVVAAGVLVGRDAVVEGGSVVGGGLVVAGMIVTGAVAWARATFAGSLAQYTWAVACKDACMHD